jgi:anti-anti-sigma factor
MNRRYPRRFRGKRLGGRIVYSQAVSAGTLQTEQIAGHSVVALHADHDLSTADNLRLTLDSARQDGRPIVVDLSGATFVDSAVLGILVSQHDQAKAAGLGFSVVLGDPPSHSVQRLVELTRIDTVLTIVPTRAEAVRVL